MDERLLDRIKNDYNLYAIAGFFFSVLYIVAIGVTVFVDPAELSIRDQDLMSGILLALSTYGLAVMLAFGAFGLINSTVIHKKGKAFAVITLIVPFVLLASIYYFWPNVFL